MLIYGDVDVGVDVDVDVDVPCSGLFLRRAGAAFAGRQGSAEFSPESGCIFIITTTISCLDIIFIAVIVMAKTLPSYRLEHLDRSGPIRDCI